MKLLDTNVWIQLIKGRNRSLVDLWRSCSAEQLAVCSVVKGELWFGATKYEDPEGRFKTLDFWLTPYVSYPFDDEAAWHYSKLRHLLERQGNIIGPNDLKIASICLAHDLTLVTGNVDEFRMVPGLKLENWS